MSCPTRSLVIKLKIVHEDQKDPKWVPQTNPGFPSVFQITWYHKGSFLDTEKIKKEQQICSEGDLWKESKKNPKKDQIVHSLQ